MGDTIHQKATGTDECPIKALALRIHHILSNGGTGENYLCDYHDGSTWKQVTSKYITDAVRKGATTLKLETKGIDSDLIGSHSLRAGGAMALKLHGFSEETIKRLGRWTSMTFLMYIHNQIAHLAKDVSKKMSMPLPYINIAAIEAS